MEMIVRELDSIAANMAASINATYSKSIIKTVADHIHDKLEHKETAVFTRTDVDTIREKLCVAGNDNGKLSLRHFECFNDIIHQLQVKRLITSPYINTPVRIPRYILDVFDQPILEIIPIVIALRSYLLQFSLPTDTDLSGRERHYYCTTYAACVIFGQMTFPSFGSDLFTLEKKDFAVDPAHLKFSFDDGNTFCRYFLPAPARIHLQRLLLFEIEYPAIPSDLDKPKASNRLLSPRSFSPRNFQSIFRTWLTDILPQIGSWSGKPPSFAQFRKAAIAASLTDFTGTANCDLYPPFVLAIQSREVKSFSLDDHYLGLLFNGKNERIDHCAPPQRIEKHEPLTAYSPLDHFISKIAVLFDTYGFSRKRFKLATRRSLAIALQSAYTPAAAYLSNIDYENVGFYVRWLCFLLNDKKTSPKRISVFLSHIPVFLNALSDEGIVSDLSKERFTDITESVFALYYSPGIRDAIVKFSEFVKFERASFDMPNWNTEERLRKPAIPTPKPLVDYSDVDAAVIMADSIFSYDYSAIIKLFIYLGIYAGMRVMEIACLKVHNVIYNDGIVICVRTSKTNNGIRNIHLSQLAPQWVVDAFFQYFEIRRQSAGMNGYIFSQSNNEPLDTSQVSSDVARLFQEIGMAHIRFHYLRHSFQNFFILRAMYAFTDVIPPQTPFLLFELFNGTNMNKFETYFLGEGEIKRGEKHFTHMLAVLSRTVGHAFCSVTESAYIHAIDWIFYFLSRHWDNKTVSLTTKQAQDLLQSSYFLLSEEFKGRGLKEFTLAEIAQRQALKLQQRSASSS